MPPPPTRLDGSSASQLTPTLHRLKLDDVITVQNRDIYGKSQGAAQDASITADASVGGFTGVGDGEADAVFLDVPEPWLALHHVKRVLRPGRTLCCYSPCIEQVMKTCEKMRELGFHTLRTIEARQRPFDGRVFPMETLDLGLGDEEAERKNAGSTRDPAALHQKWTQLPRAPTAAAPDAATDAAEAADAVEAVADDDAAAPQPDDTALAADGDDDQGETDDAASSKKRKLDEATDGAVGDADAPTKRQPFKNLPRAAVNGQYTMHIGRPVTSMKGHTAFLTFAYAPV